MGVNFRDLPPRVAFPETTTLHIANRAWGEQQTMGGGSENWHPEMSGVNTLFEPIRLTMMTKEVFRDALWNEGQFDPVFRAKVPHIIVEEMRELVLMAIREAAEKEVRQPE